MVKIKRFVKKRKPKKRSYKKKFRANKLDQKDLKEWSLKVRARDNFICLNCSSRKNLHAHHMVSKFYLPKYAFTLYNGITLCKKCHLGHGGVHHKSSKPSTGFIAQLRRIYKMNDIHSAKIISKKLCN